MAVQGWLAGVRRCPPRWPTCWSGGDKTAWNGRSVALKQATVSRACVRRARATGKSIEHAWTAGVPTRRRTVSVS